MKFMKRWQITFIVIMCIIMLIALGLGFYGIYNWLVDIKFFCPNHASVKSVILLTFALSVIVSLVLSMIIQALYDLIYWLGIGLSKIFKLCYPRINKK
jgi:hypothetical protein